MAADLRSRAEAEFASAWFAKSIKIEGKARLVRSVLFLALSGESTTLAAAATDAGIPSGTVRSWASRDEFFAAAVAEARGRAAPVPEPNTPMELDAEHARLREDVERFRRAIRYEQLRLRNGRWGDPRRAERLHDAAVVELNSFEHRAALAP